MPSTNKTLIFAAFIVISLLITEIHSDWHYEVNNPDEWVDEFPQCGGVLQSPINIETTLAKYNKALKPINFTNYDYNFSWNFTNNGHTIFAMRVTDTNNTQPYISGSDFGQELFYLSQFHFHWGSNHSLGSEHHIDDGIFPLELHLVHKSNLGKIAVIGFIFELNETSNTNLDSLIRIIGVEVAENSTNSVNLNLHALLPDFDKANEIGYYRYMGSLTTPPCTEDVIWTVYKTKIPISDAQLASFYLNEIHFNYREVQKLNKRTLYVSVFSGANGPSFDQLPLMLLMLFSSFYLFIIS